MEKEPSFPERPKQELIARLCRLKTNYKDGIPDEIKHSTSKDSGWKVQRLWFHLVVGELGKIIKRQYSGEALLSKELSDELFAYWESFASPDHPLKHRLTQQSDIDEAEAMIDKVIAELEK